MLLDRRIVGRVLTRAGRPAANVMIEVLPAHPGPNDSPIAHDSATTDVDGQYEFEYLRTGDYYLGVNLDRPPFRENPYARWFFPGTEEPARATIVHLPEAPGVQAFDLILPEPQKDRIIEARDPSGSREADGSYAQRRGPPTPSMSSWPSGCSDDQPAAAGLGVNRPLRVGPDVGRKLPVGRPLQPSASLRARAQHQRRRTTLGRISDRQCF